MSLRIIISYTSTVISKLNAIAEILSEILILNYNLKNGHLSNTFVTLSELQGHLTGKNDRDL